MFKDYLEGRKYLNKKLKEGELLLNSSDIIEEYVTLLNALEVNNQKEIAKSLKSIASMIKYEDDLIAFSGNVIPDSDAKVTEELYYNRLDFKIAYNYNLATGSKDLLVHSFFVKTLKDLYEIILNDPSKEENPTYYNELLKEYKRFVIEYMMCNPEFEKNMIKNNLDITKISCEVPEIDSKLALAIISKHSIKVWKNYDYSGKVVFNLMKSFNQKLFENVYPYLSDETKATLENGNSYGR